MLNQKKQLLIAGAVFALVLILALLFSLTDRDQASQGLEPHTAPVATLPSSAPTKIKPTPVEPPQTPSTLDASASTSHSPKTPAPPATDQLPPASISSYQYFPNGQLQKILYSDGTSYSYRYNASGEKISETDRTGGTWTYIYDENHHSIRTLDPNGIIKH